MRILKYTCPHCAKTSALRIRELEEKDRRIAELEAEIERIRKESVDEILFRNFFRGMK